MRTNEREAHHYLVSRLASSSANGRYLFILIESCGQCFWRRPRLNVCEVRSEPDARLPKYLRHPRKRHTQYCCNLFRRELFVIVKGQNQLFSLTEFGNGFGKMSPRVAFQAKSEWVRVRSEE